MRYRIGFSSKKDSASVYIEYSVRKPGMDHPVREIVKRLGKKKDLLTQDPDALLKLQRTVDEMNQKCQSRQFLPVQSSLKSIAADLSRELDEKKLFANSCFMSRSAGWLILRNLYDELRWDAKFDYIAKGTSIQYDLAKIVKDLVLLRILSPASKLRTSMQGPEKYLGASCGSVDHIYKSLDLLCRHKADIVKYWNLQAGRCVPERDTSVCLYDITTYAFESTDQDALRDFGFSKDQKVNEVQVVMALATDQRGLPLDYALYKGNQAEAATMVPFISELKKKFKVSNFTVVADRGLNSKSNIDALIKLGDNYVLSSKIRGASEDIKTQVLDPDGRTGMTKVSEDGEIMDTGWYKEIRTEEPIRYAYPDYAFEEGGRKKEELLKEQLRHQSTRSGKTVKSTLKRRYIVTWSEARERKDRKDRERLLKKARYLISQPSVLKSNFKRGGRSFVLVDMELDSVRLDENLIREQSRFDGIHVVETSLDAPASEILKIYGNLWRIEESFRHLKTQFNARPVYVRLPDHVRGHFLTCFLALCVCRYLEYKLEAAGRRVPLETVIEKLNSTRIASITPTKTMEFYAAEGFDNEVIRSVMGVAGLEVPNNYELPAELRRKLKLRSSMHSLFASTTNKK